MEIELEIYKKKFFTSDALNFLNSHIFNACLIIKLYYKNTNLHIIEKDKSKFINKPHLYKIFRKFKYNLKRNLNIIFKNKIYFKY